MKSSVFFLSASIVIIIFSYCSIFPQSADDTLSGQPEKLHTFNVYFINGYALSYEFSKYNQSLLRVQLDFSGSSSDENLDEERSSIYSYASEGSFSSRENNYSSISISLSPQYIYSFLKTDLGEAYAGTGPFLNFSRSENVDSYTGTSADSTTLRGSSNSKDKNYSLGIIFILGIKANLTKNIGIFAESNISGGKRWTENDYISTNVIDYPNMTDYSSTNTAHESGGGWFYNATYVRIGISISI